jgi:hypothetical protein
MRHQGGTAVGKGARYAIVLGLFEWLGTALAT